MATLLAAGITPTGRMPRWYTILIGATLTLLVVTALVGAAPLAQLLGRAPRYEGLVAVLPLIAAGWAGARLLGPGAEQRDRRRFLDALSWASVLLAAVAAAEAVGLRPIESDLARPGSLAGNATDQAILGVVFAAVLGASVIGAQRRGEPTAWWSVVGTIAGVVSVATSASRAGLLALAIVAIGLTALTLATSRRRRRDSVVALAIVIAAFLITVAVPLTRARLFGTSTFAQQTIGDRIIIWTDAARLFATVPWTGVGPNGFADAITPLFEDGWFDRAQVGAILDSPHDVALQAAVVAGIPGLLLASALVVGAVVLGIRHAIAPRGGVVRGDDRAFLIWGGLCGVVAAGAALLTHVSSPTTLVPLATLVGILVAVAPSRRRPWSLWGQGIIACWLIGLVVLTAADGMLREARVAAAHGDLARAGSMFATAQALRPWDVDIALEAAQTLGAAVENGLAGAADDARAWAERAIAHLPHSSRAQYVAGMVAQITGDTAGAVTHLHAAAELSPADPRIRHEAGVARLAAGDPAGAVADLERALELAPESEVTRSALRDACRRLGDDACVARTSSYLGSESR